MIWCFVNLLQIKCWRLLFWVNCKHFLVHQQDLVIAISQFVLTFNTAFNLVQRQEQQKKPFVILACIFCFCAAFHRNFCEKQHKSRRYKLLAWLFSFQWKLIWHNDTLLRWIPDFLQNLRLAGLIMKTCKTSNQHWPVELNF